MQNLIYIKTRNLSKQYEPQHTALHPVNMTVYKKDIYGIVGAKGAGKTTLMKLLTGLTERTSGDYELFGKSGHETTAERKHIACLIGEPVFFDGMTAYQNLKYYCIQRNILTDRIDTALAQVGLTDFANKKMKKATPAIRRKLALALTLVDRTDLVFWDEPFRDLDPETARQLSELIPMLREQVDLTFILSSENLSELLPIAGTILFLDHGKVLKELPFPANAIAESGLSPEEYVKSLYAEGKS